MFFYWDFLNFIGCSLLEMMDNALGPNSALGRKCRGKRNVTSRDCFKGLEAVYFNPPLRNSFKSASILLPSRPIAESTKKGENAQSLTGRDENIFIPYPILLIGLYSETQFLNTIASLEFNQIKPKKCLKVWILNISTSSSQAQIGMTPTYISSARHLILVISLSSTLSSNIQ